MSPLCDEKGKWEVEELKNFKNKIWCHDNQQNDNQQNDNQQNDNQQNDNQRNDNRNNDYKFNNTQYINALDRGTQNKNTQS